MTGSGLFMVPDLLCVLKQWTTCWVELFFPFSCNTNAGQVKGPDVVFLIPALYQESSGNIILVVACREVALLCVLGRALEIKLKVTTCGHVTNPNSSILGGSSPRQGTVKD